MLTKYVSGLLVMAGAWAIAQQTSDSQLTQLYYNSRVASEELPSVSKSSPQTPNKSRPAAVSHLGLRYNLVLFNQSTRRFELVPSDRNFRAGDCLAIDFDSNRSGYLYVLAQQSSGFWKPLLPSPKMPEESNVLNPGRKTRVPKGYCYIIKDPPGTEKWFVILSRDPSDIYKLHEAINHYSEPQPDAVPETGGQPLQIAGLVKNEVARFGKQAENRDTDILKISEPLKAQEPAHSVYVVNKSNKPFFTLVTEIEVRHHQ